MSDPLMQRPAGAPSTGADPREIPAPERTRVRSGGSTGRYVLTGGLFVLLVGAIAWITQFMPNWRAAKKNSGAPGPDAGTAALLKFSFTRAIWDPNDEEYALELERGKEAHFDYPFENVAGQAAEIGLVRLGCDCSVLEACIAPAASDWERYRKELLDKPVTAKAGDWTWVKITPGETAGFDVPADAKGFIRLGWKGRKDSGQRLRLTAQLWHQPKGNVHQRAFENLEAPSMITAPVLFAPTRINVGSVGPRDSKDAEATLWSATRTTLHDLQLESSGNPLFVAEITPLSSEECAALEKKLRKEGHNTRVRTASQLRVKIKGQAGAKQLPQGPFNHPTNFILDDDKVRGPQVVGVGTGDIVVGNAEDRGKVDVGTFRGKDGAKRGIYLWADEDLAVESQVPATLEVKLTKAEKAGTRAKWRLELAVPPDTHYGVFPEESVIILRTQTTPPRFIRIPVVGNGQS